VKYSVYLVLVILVICTSCKKESNWDQSLSIEEYKDMGMPDPNRVWDTEELTTAINVLSGIKWSKPYILPRKNSEKSGELFKRMISLDNMFFGKGDSLQLHEKAILSSEFLQIFGRWQDVYTHPMLKKQYYHTELVDISINEVRITEMMVELQKEIMASDDPLDVMLQPGAPGIRSNYISSLKNALNIQSYASHFLDEDLALLTDSLSASMVRNRSWMDSLSVEELKSYINIVLDSTSSQYVQARYGILKEKL